jgi:GT2 family glycosyltransferase
MARRVNRPPVRSSYRKVRQDLAAGAADAIPVPEGPPATADTGIFRVVEPATRELVAVEVFDEAGYLRLNPDVRSAIELGHFESGYAHYCLYGNDEGRPLPDMPREARNVMLPSSGAGPSAAAMPVRCSIDALFVAPGAGLMVVGWIDDVTHPMSCIRIMAAGWRVVLDASRLVRLRRMDVEKALGDRAQHAFGFFGVLHFEQGGQAAGPVTIELWQQGGFSSALQCLPTVTESSELRNTALAHMAGASFFGSAAIESMSFLARGLGSELIRLNQAITRRAVAAPYVERFGEQRKSPRGSIVVCLYGKAEFYFVQNCLYSGLAGIDDYEFIYVSNSPEMAETLLREAHSASLTYGLSNTVMILAGNAGFGAANNTAAGVARSNRLLIVNPDVFPRDQDWARKHSELLDSAAPEQTRLFGVPLYYDDGSLMHGGMYFDTDVGFAMASGTPVAQQICRVEHYGKGAPPDSAQFTRPRPVPAVTGAFMSIDRSWFETLGGFTDQFIFGHYEDADLCLKSIDKGVAPWLQDIRMWHLEGKGSTRQLAHEGGSMVNRWLFSQTWMSTIESSLKGPAPHHPLFEPLPARTPARPAVETKSIPSRRSRALR